MRNMVKELFTLKPTLNIQQTCLLLLTPPFDNARKRKASFIAKSIINRLMAKYKICHVSKSQSSTRRRAGKTKIANALLNLCNGRDWRYLASTATKNHSLCLAICNKSRAGTSSRMDRFFKKNRSASKGLFTSKETIRFDQPTTILPILDDRTSIEAVTSRNLLFRKVYNSHHDNNDRRTVRNR